MRNLMWSISQPGATPTLAILPSNYDQRLMTLVLTRDITGKRWEFCWRSPGYNTTSVDGKTHRTRHDAKMYWLFVMCDRWQFIGGKGRPHFCQWNGHKQSYDYPGVQILAVARDTPLKHDSYPTLGDWRGMGARGVTGDPTGRHGDAA